jgi:hypothetical protein
MRITAAIENWNQGQEVLMRLHTLWAKVYRTYLFLVALALSLFI